ncbi:hypothetical protein [Shouchella patagoniensis]|uniref:hypothetical protein n=1 Tax=Shouchella patagoniensis TaxID=228576 RepID=UPI000994A779|nr:hypothetical protein [Shouchella patagoniensis]
MNSWYKLDNTANIFHAVEQKGNSSVYRVALMMHGTVQKEQLQLALDDTINHFSMFSVKLSKGFFWDSLEENKKKIRVEQEIDTPCSSMDSLKNNGHLIRVLYFKKRISVEIFHSLTDGNGALVFLKALVTNYIHYCGYNKDQDLNRNAAYPKLTPYALDDSYKNYTTEEKSYKETSGHANKVYKLRGTDIDYTAVTQGILDANEVRKRAKIYGVSVTAFLTSVLILSIFKANLRYRLSQEEIIIALPVDLRSNFPSESLRNFFSVINVGTKIEDQTTMEELTALVSKEMQIKTQKEYLQHAINNQVKWKQMLSARFVPIFIKYIFMRYGFTTLGEKKKTMTLTNLGKISLPDEVTPYVEHMEVLMYPTPQSPINVGSITFNNRLVLSFTRKVEEMDVISLFFKELSTIHNLDITLYSNDNR